MPERAQRTRRYESPRRRDQAAATRRAILEAAQRRFERDGYAATTIAAIAAEAGVAAKTVYVAFETKSGVLRALWHLLLRGDEGDRPVAERDWYREMVAEPDPVARIARIAENSRLVKLRIAGVFEVIRTAAPADADIAALWDRIQTEFHGYQRDIVAGLRDAGALRSELTVDRGADVLWTLVHPDVWQLLVGRCGWTPEAYEAWLADALRAQLLDVAALRARTAPRGRR